VVSEEEVQVRSEVPGAVICPGEKEAVQEGPPQFLATEQLTLFPPFDPAQVQIHGPEPATVEAVPTRQYSAVTGGCVQEVVPLRIPHSPLTGLALGEQITLVRLLSKRHLSPSDAVATHLYPLAH